MSKGKGKAALQPENPRTLVIIVATGGAAGGPRLQLDKWLEQQEGLHYSLEPVEGETRWHKSRVVMCNQLRTIRPVVNPTVGVRRASIPIYGDGNISCVVL